MLQSNCSIISGIFTRLGLVNGLSELASGAGVALGPVSASLLYEVGGWQLPFLACGGWMIGVSVLAPPLYYVAMKLSIARREARCEAVAASQETEAMPQEEQQHHHVLARIWQICTSSLLLPAGSLLISNCVWGIILGGFYTIHASKNLHMSEIAIGTNITAASTAATLVTLLVGYLSDKLGHERIMVFGLLVVAFSLALLGPVGQLCDAVNNAKRWWEFSCMILLGLGQSASTVPGFAAMMRAAPENSCAREACSSLFVASIQGGMVFGSLLSVTFGLNFVRGTGAISTLLCCYATAWMAKLHQPLIEGAGPCQCQEHKRTTRDEEEAQLVKV
jgi:MFS family permease